MQRRDRRAEDCRVSTASASERQRVHDSRTHELQRVVQVRMRARTHAGRATQGARRTAPDPGSCSHVRRPCTGCSAQEPSVLASGMCSRADRVARRRLRGARSAERAALASRRSMPPVPARAPVPRARAGGCPRARLLACALALVRVRGALWSSVRPPGRRCVRRLMAQRRKACCRRFRPAWAGPGGPAPLPLRPQAAGCRPDSARARASGPLLPVDIDNLTVRDTRAPRTRAAFNATPITPRAGLCAMPTPMPSHAQSPTGSRLAQDQAGTALHVLARARLKHPSDTGTDARTKDLRTQGSKDPSTRGQHPGCQDARMRGCQDARTPGRQNPAEPVELAEPAELAELAEGRAGGLGPRPMTQWLRARYRSRYGGSARTRFASLPLRREEGRRHRTRTQTPACSALRCMRCMLTPRSRGAPRRAAPRRAVPCRAVPRSCSRSGQLIISIHGAVYACTCDDAQYML